MRGDCSVPGCGPLSPRSVAPAPLCERHLSILPEKVRRAAVGSPGSSLAINHALAVIGALSCPASERPTLFLGHPSARGSHGPGAKWCAMGAPREFERGEGQISALAPDPALVLQVKRGELGLGPYRAAYLRRLADRLDEGLLHPGCLRARRESGESVLVEHGDTAWCACGRRAVRRHRCHLAWACAPLEAAGWRVRIFGESPSGPKQGSLFGVAV